MIPEPTIGEALAIINDNFARLEHKIDGIEDRMDGLESCMGSLVTILAKNGVITRFEADHVSAQAITA